MRLDLGKWAALALFLSVGLAHAQKVSLSVDRDIYAGLPFVLSITAEGFDESPQPTVGGVEINGAEVEFIGVAPNVFSSISIVGGRRSATKEVQFIYRYRITVPTAGRYELPPIRVNQGTQTAQSAGAEFRASEIDSTENMRLSLVLPDRPVWIGETFELHIDWLLRSDPGNPKFILPLFDREDLVRVAVPETPNAKTLPFRVGDRELELPYSRTQVVVDGVSYSRFRFTAEVTPQRAGSIEVPAAAVVAELQTGVGRDRFGFRRRQRGLFQARDVSRSFEVKPVPARGKPTSFAGAVGSGFSIDTQASRTVVRVGDPIDLSITVRGEAGLKGLRLPPLTGDSSLAPEHFEVPAELPPGEITEDSVAKRFVVPIRLRSTEVREIPEIEFSFFDPTTASYKTVRSQPIALSIAGSSLVGASDVVAAARPSSTETATPAVGTVVDADLSLSNRNETLRTVISVADLLPLLCGLYLLSAAFFFLRVWLHRTSKQRFHSSDIRQARKALKAALASARELPAREAAPAVLSAVRRLTRLTTIALDKDLIERLETEGFKRDADAVPLPGELMDRLSQWSKETQRSLRSSGTSPSALALIVAVATISGLGHADSTAPPLTTAQERYASALEEPERDERARRFEEVAKVYAELSRSYRDRPELLADWGNAALGARDFGTATLAYRRALALDPGLLRAAKNLEWLRKNGPAHAATPPATSVTDTLFFWHTRLSAAQKHLLAAFAFAVAMLLFAPWAPAATTRRTLRWLAIVPVLGVAAMFASILLAPSIDGDVVVIDGTAVLRSADSIGAPLTRDLPPGAGAEAVAIIARDGWVRLRFADGESGWLPRPAVAWVAETDSAAP